MVELALWTHNIVSDLRPELLGKAPKSPSVAAPTNGGSPLPSDESNLEPPSTNGNGKYKLHSTFAVYLWLSWNSSTASIDLATLASSSYSSAGFRPGWT